jgi:uncharacterized RDD family membrane protein YckC
MKCPKCSYISYDMPERCRNCGYDFPLAPDPAAVDLDLRTDRDAGPAPDFALSPRPERDLPLFSGPSDGPLVTPSATPRTPLSVRRSPTDPSRQRQVPKRDRRAGVSRTPAAPVIVTPAAVPGRNDPAPLLATAAVAARDAAVDDPADDAPALTGFDEEVPAAAAPTPMAVGDAAPPLRRLAAAAIDVAVIVAIDVAVIRLTLAVLGASWSYVPSLRWLPLSMFFALLNGGYLVAFTVASGQTIGKMLTGVRVVGETSLGVPVAQAVVRAVVLALAVAPLGLGYLPVLVTRSARGIHDRLSNTRVIRA